MSDRSLTYVVRPSHAATHLLVLLHGYGSNENDLFGLAPYFDERYTIVSVRAPCVLAQGRYAWFETDFINDGLTYIPDHVLDATQQLGQFLAELMKTHSMSAGQVTLLGFSQGSMMSALIALTQPQLIGRAVLLSGFVLPETQDHLAETDHLAQLQVFVGHGLFDNVIPIEYGRATHDLLAALNVSHIYREYATTHSIHDECLDDILTWLDESPQT